MVDQLFRKPQPIAPILGVFGKLTRIDLGHFWPFLAKMAHFCQVKMGQICGRHFWAIFAKKGDISSPFLAKIAKNGDSLFLAIFGKNRQKWQLLVVFFGDFCHFLAAVIYLCR